MRRYRVLALALAAALVLSLAGAAMAAQHPASGPAKGDKPAAAQQAKPKTLERSLSGLLLKDDKGFLLVSGRLAYRIEAGQGVDLAPHVLKVVQLRVRAQDGKWVVVSVRKTGELRFIAAPAPGAAKPSSKPSAKPSRGQSQPTGTPSGQQGGR